MAWVSIDNTLATSGNSPNTLCINEELMTKKEEEFNLENFLEEENKQVKIEYDEQRFVVMHKEFQKALGLPGIPLSDVSLGFGLSDSESAFLS